MGMEVTERRQRRSPGRARFRQLVNRALFELRMAGDVARAEGFWQDVSALVEGSKRNLRTCLDRDEPSELAEDAPHHPRRPKAP